MKLSKKASRLTEDILLRVDPIAYTPPTLNAMTKPKEGQRYPWKNTIVTTIFWIGEDASGNNPVPNHSSSWDKHWGQSYGGFDDPNRARRENYIPVKFTPRQNPFYCALPYNDKANTGHRSEAPRVVPWFKEAYQGPAFAKTAGWRFAKAIERFMRNGKTRARFAPITGNTSLETSVRNPI